MLEQAHVDPAQVSYIIQDTNRNWMRDSGPAIVKNTNGYNEAIQFGFTGWAVSWSMKTNSSRHDCCVGGNHLYISSNE